MFVWKILSLFFISFQVNAQSYKFNNLNLSVDWISTQSTTWFTIVHNKSSNYTDAWIAIGFNTDQLMDGGNGVVCSIINNTPSVEHYYFDGNTPKLMSTQNKDFGLMNTSVMFTGSQIICKFERQNEINVTNYFGTNQNVYILSAMGIGSFKFHGENYGQSAKTFNLQFINNPPETSTTPKSTALKTSPNPTTIKMPDLNNNLHKFSMNITVNWKVQESNTWFSMRFPKPTGFTTGWFALGFNSIQEMSGGNGVVCLISSTNSSNFVVEHHYFDGNTPKPLNASDKIFGVKNAKLKMENSDLIFDFERENSNNISNYVSTNQQVYFLAAYGSGLYKYHGDNREYSLSSYNLNLVNEQEVSTSKPTNTTDGKDTINTDDINRLLQDLTSKLNDLMNQLNDFLNMLDFKKVLDQFNDLFKF
ncbi:unnamed protein product [Brachionus calyciflorus]|uniref:DOMON domain-containing protein n=1 Tax=Brachionus calyciflorus TaxID=104777 RepID=A0A813T2H8_9BILA|nr:unnamed protein product [Brachionus calyciflorus]